MFSYPTTIKKEYLDLLGHVNHAVYFKLFEEARWDFVAKNGYGPKEVEKNQKGPVILEAHAYFKKELKEGDKITIQTEVLTFRRKTWEVEQKMINNGQIYAEGRFKMGFFDMRERRLILPPHEWEKALGRTGSKVP